MSILALIIGLGALGSAYVPWRWSVAAAYVAMLLAWLAAPAGTLQTTPLILWGVSALLVIGLNVMLPPKSVTSRRGVAYLVTGSVAGAAIGLAIGQSWLVLGAVVGVILGALAYAGTPAGRTLTANPRDFLSFACAKGFPAVVTVAISAISIFWSLLVMTR